MHTGIQGTELGWQARRVHVVPPGRAFWCATCHNSQPPCSCAPRRAPARQPSACKRGGLPCCSSGITGLTAAELSQQLGFCQDEGFLGARDFFDLLVSLGTLERDGGVAARPEPPACVAPHVREHAQMSSNMDVVQPQFFHHLVLNQCASVLGPSTAQPTTTSMMRSLMTKCISRQYTHNQYNLNSPPLALAPRVWPVRPVQVTPRQP